MAALKTRQIQERWIIEGELELVTPASLSNGDDDPIVDLPLLTDPLTGEALLTGSSLAGALRSHLDRFAYADSQRSPAVVLFGGRRQDEKGAQSPLIVEDALGGAPQVELRDGVSIDPRTRTAREGAKYDRELLAAGTVFAIGFELLLDADDAEVRKAALAQALTALEEGQLRLGGSKRRGLGQCRVRSWRAWRYDLTSAAGLHSWLVHGRNDVSWHTDQALPWQGERVRDWPPLADVATLRDERRQFVVEGDFDIDGSVLIRAGFEADTAPDTTHLRSQRGGDPVPVLTGTSLAGVIRAQAQRIARTVARSDTRAERFVNHLFGYMLQNPEEDDVRLASRVIVSESEIEGDYVDLVQSRVRIDRFTGGAFESALFTEQPVFGGETRLRWQIENPTEADIGLLLLVLKDLWTGIVPVGGEASVGRGRLRGQQATLLYQTPAGEKQWQLQASNGAGLTIGGDEPALLNQYVDAFVEAMGGM